MQNFPFVIVAIYLLFFPFFLFLCFGSAFKFLYIKSRSNWQGENAKQPNQAPLRGLQLVTFVYIVIVITLVFLLLLLGW